MGQSLVENYIHIVFSTKNRQPLISSSIEKEFHAYIGGICKELDSTPLKVGGYDDHIHILCRLSKKIAIMTLVQKIKAGSSKWIKSKGERYNNFYWQGGYGAFSVSPKQMNVVKRYIENQREHHTHKSFKEEYTEMLHKSNIDYTADYLWD